jgi:hypothetical protein
MNATQRYWIRRAELQQRSSLLRDRLSTHAVTTQPLFGAVEQVRKAGRWARQHPWVPILLASAVLLRRPRTALRWAWKGWMTWRWVNTWCDRWQRAGRP